MMIIDPDGGQVGTLGGGCVENEVKQKAIQQIGGDDRGRPFVYPRPRLRLGGWPDLRRQDGGPHAASEGAGPLEYFRTLDQVIEESRGFTEAIVIDAQAGRRRRRWDAFLVRWRGPKSRARWPGLPWSRTGSIGHMFRRPNGPNRRFTTGSPSCRTGRVSG